MQSCSFGEGVSMVGLAWETLLPAASSEPPLLLDWRDTRLYKPPAEEPTLWHSQRRAVSSPGADVLLAGLVEWWTETATHLLKFSSQVYKE